MSLDPVRIYLISFCGLVCCPLLLIAIRWCGDLLAPHIRHLRATTVHSTLTFWPRTTYLQTLTLVLYTGLNGIVLSFGIREGESLSKRASLIASANLMLLFVGGRTNPLVDFVQIPLFTYSFLHRWISVIATCEALLHSSIELYHRGLKDKNAISGCMIAGGLVAALIVALWPGRGLGRFFGKVHLLLYVTSAFGLVWHALMQASALARIPAFVCCGMWTGTHLCRFIRMFILGHTYAEVVDYQEEVGSVRVRLRLVRHATFFPGCYFYIFFKGPLPFYDLFHGYPMMPVWVETELSTSEVASELSFIISKTGTHGKSLQTIRKGQHLRLDGPYGRDLRLQSYETVMLAAKGMGIIGVLPFARYLAERRKHDDTARNKAARLHDSREPVFGDLSRNVDLIWWLEDAHQGEWVAEHLRKLQQIDSKNLLVVWCIYPSQQKTNPSFHPNQFWKARTGFDAASFARELRQETRYPGNNVLLACGDATFVDTMRSMALENTTTERFIKFVEVEFRPEPTESLAGKQQDHIGGDIELQRCPDATAAHRQPSWASEASETTLAESINSSAHRSRKKGSDKRK